jgi:hypothetical protein
MHENFPAVCRSNAIGALNARAASHRRVRLLSAAVTERLSNGQDRLSKKRLSMFIFISLFPVRDTQVQSAFVGGMDAGGM